MAMEIRLGSGESMTNVNLGSTEIQEIYLGQILVWRNNVLPFFALSVNGTLVSSNGTPELPLDPDTPEDADITVFEYLNSISITISNVQDEDLQYPIVFNLYEGDFDLDETLTPIGDAVSVAAATPGLAGTWDPQPGKPVPTGPTAGNYLETNQLYSLVGVDAEDGISIQYFVLTVNDSADVRTITPFTNVGSPFGASVPQPAVVTGPFSFESNTQCYDPIKTTTTYTTSTIGVNRSINQVRTCSVQINGIEDTPALTCVGVPLTNVGSIQVSSSSSDTITGSVDSANGAYITGATISNNVGGPGITGISSLVSAPVLGTCAVGPLNGSACAAALATCTQSDGSQTSTVTTTPRTQDRNCAGAFIGAPILGTPSPATSTVSCNYSYTNPAFVAPANISSAIFSIDGNIATSVNYTFGANFSAPLSDDGNVGALRRIVAGTVTWNNITAGTSSSFGASITATEAGCAGAPGCGGMTSVSDPALNAMSPLPSVGDVVLFSFNVGPSSYNTSDGGNVAGSGSAGPISYTWS